MDHKLLYQSKKVAKRTMPTHMVRHRSTRRIIQKFADDLGMVYFGYVDQRDDEHRLVRGITVSPTHDDTHYTVGSYKSYDISVVIRRDSFPAASTGMREHYWTILTIDLHSMRDVPQLYIGHRSLDSVLRAKYSQLIAIMSHPDPRHAAVFTNQYTVYSSMTYAQEVYAVLTPNITEVIGSQFEGISIEVQDNTLYLYATEKHPSRVLLERLLRQGTWLAQMLDHQLEILEQSE